MPTRRRRTTALALTLAALLALTACDDGQGVRDEGPATNKAASLVPGESQKAARH